MQQIFVKTDEAVSFRRTSDKSHDCVMSSMVNNRVRKILNKLDA